MIISLELPEEGPIEMEPFVQKNNESQLVRLFREYVDIFA